MRAAKTAVVARPAVMYMMIARISGVMREYFMISAAAQRKIPFVLLMVRIPSVGAFFGILVLVVYGSQNIVLIYIRVLAYSLPSSISR